jgi:hypothetical protein
MDFTNLGHFASHLSENRWLLGGIAIARGSHACAIRQLVAGMNCLARAASLVSDCHMDLLCFHVVVLPLQTNPLLVAA